MQLATDLGYAEADPTADIEGYDAGRKLAILASIAFHTSVTFDDVFTEGITENYSEGYAAMQRKWAAASSFWGCEEYGNSWM